MTEQPRTSSSSRAETAGLSRSSPTHARPGHAITPLQRSREQRLVDEVVQSFEGAESVRLQEVMKSLTTHLHDFVREVRLTQDEWQAASTSSLPPDTSPTNAAKSSSCSPTCSACPCRPSPSTTRRLAKQPRQRSSERSTSRTLRKSNSGETWPSVREVSHAGSRASCAALTVNRSPQHGSTSGRPMRTASTTSNTRMNELPRAAACSRTRRGGIDSGL